MKEESLVDNSDIIGFTISNCKSVTNPNGSITLTGTGPGEVFHCNGVKIELDQGSSVTVSDIKQSVDQGWTLEDHDMFGTAGSINNGEDEMTQLEILQRGLEHWQYLLDNNSTDKLDYEPATMWENNCVFCDESSSCTYCAMGDGWGVDPNQKVTCCESLGSAFHLYTQKPKEGVKAMIKVIKRKIKSLELEKHDWMVQDLSDLKVGDDVYSLVSGAGVVSNNSWSSDNKFLCKFGDSDRIFNSKGMGIHTDKNQTLFKGKHHPFNPQPNPLELRVGDEILCSNNGVHWSKNTFITYLEDTEEWISKNQDGNICTHNIAKLPIKIETRVKSAIAVMEHLVAGGYKVDKDGSWYGSDESFETEMWQYCGKVPDGAWHWEPEWLEEIEILTK